MTPAFQLAGKLAAFKIKLELWRQQVNSGIFDTFQTLTEILRETEKSSPSQCMITYLSFRKSLSITSQPKKDPEL